MKKWTILFPTYKHVYKPEFKLNPKAASRTKTNANRLDSGINGTFAPSIPSATVILHLKPNPPAIYCLHLPQRFAFVFILFPALWRPDVRIGRQPHMALPFRVDSSSPRY
jgi:hypothetical protein